MIDIFNTITIDNEQIFRPSDFDLKREDVYAGEYTTCTGAVIADRIGWRYSDIELKYDTLPDDQMQTLLGMSGECNLTFTDSDGSHTEKVIRLAFSNAPTRFTAYDGSVLWKDVAVSLRFINVHN